MTATYDEDSEASLNQFAFKNYVMTFPYFCFQLFVYLISTCCAAPLLERPDPIDELVIILRSELRTARFCWLNDGTNCANRTDWRTDSILSEIFQSTVPHGVLDILVGIPISIF